MLDRYDLGEIRSVREFVAGSSAAPKAIIEAGKGTFLLKRRARGLDDPFRVAFDHEVQLHVRAGGFCAPRLVGTKGENNSLLQHAGRVYELFVFVDGVAWNRSPAQARAAGAALAHFQLALAGLRPRWPTPPEPTPPLDAARLGAERLGALAPALGDVSRVLAQIVERAHHAGGEASTYAHGDWHPGNMLFTADAVAGVFDYDGARPDAPDADLAQGLAYFSVQTEGDAPDGWAVEPDPARLQAFWAGYAGAAGVPAELAPVPAAMARTLALEALGPLGAGLLGRPDARAALDSIARKARWLLDHADQVAGWLESAPNR